MGWEPKPNPIFYDNPLVDLQAVLFYVPRWLWKNWEAGKITALMMDLDIGVVSEVEKKQKKKLLLDYLYDNLKNHNWWAYRYFFCELLAFCNIIGEKTVGFKSKACNLKLSFHFRSNVLNGQIL